MSRLVTIGSVWLRPNADSSSGSINSSRLLAFRTRGHTDNDLQPSPPHIVKFVRVPTAFRSAQLSSPKDVPILIGGHDRSAEGRERGPGHEERAATLSLPSRGSRERLSSPNVESPTAQRFSTIFSTQMASPDTIILLIVDYHAPIGGKTPVPPTLHTPCHYHDILISPIFVNGN